MYLFFCYYNNKYHNKREKTCWGIGYLRYLRYLNYLCIQKSIVNYPPTEDWWAFDFIA